MTEFHERLVLFQNPSLRLNLHAFSFLSYISKSKWGPNLEYRIYSGIRKSTKVEIGNLKGKFFLQNF